jgi:hypothetical protein
MQHIFNGNHNYCLISIGLKIQYIAYMSILQGVYPREYTLIRKFMYMHYVFKYKTKNIIKKNETNKNKKHTKQKHTKI